MEQRVWNVDNGSTVGLECGRDLVKIDKPEMKQ